MAQAQTYQGTFQDIAVRYGKELADRQVTITVDEADNGTVTRTFHETATAEEWIREFREWAASHESRAVPLSDEAVDRDSIYEGRG